VAIDANDRLGCARTQEIGIVNSKWRRRFRDESHVERCEQRLAIREIINLVGREGPSAASLCALARGDSECGRE
jgi:hypothetical protein